MDNKTQSGVCVLLKNGRKWSRAAWLHSDSDKSSLNKASEEKTSSENVLLGNNGEDGNLGSSEKTPLRLHRRQKASSSSAAVPLNPDLLTIPGVGPRNFRKLVEKGIAGVAQLKQLYKDKVYGC